MYRSLPWLALALTVASCRGASEDDRTRPPDMANRSGGAQLEDEEAGVEYEAPRLIPSLRAQMSAIASPTGRSSENLTSFRNALDTLVNAMKADLNRVGTGDTGAFQTLSDSLLREIGGGPGTTVELPPEKVDSLIPRVERLLGLYETGMRGASR